jgi:hypothetical protein
MARLGYGPRHGRDKLVELPEEQHDRKLKEARKEIDRLQHRCTALESTVRTINRLSAHYVNDRKPR